MITNKTSPVLFLLLLSVYFSSAQGVADALRYSQFEVNSTARSVAVGNSMGALGADFSVASTNPAGIAMFRSSEMLLSPQFRYATANSDLLSDPSFNSTEDDRFNFQLNTIGIVIAGQTRNPRWRTMNFAIGFNRIANFKQRFTFDASSAGSITDFWLDQVNSGNVDNFQGEVAIDAEAVFDIDGDGIFETDFSFVPLEQLVPKSQTVLRDGSINELVFTLAGNYEEKLMFGATLGVPFVSFQEEKTYREFDDGAGPEGDVPFFEDLEFREFLSTTGIGINFKLGLIYRASQMVRLGLAVHSPTAYGLEDNFSTELDYNFLNNGIVVLGEGNSDDGTFNYRINSPWRFIGNGGVLIAKKGFVSAQIEWVNYGSARLRFDGFGSDEEIVNADIEAALQSALNVRLGGEYAYQNYRFRAGFALLQSPYADESTFNLAYSLGAGIRGQTVYFDLALRRTENSEIYEPYFSENVLEQVVENNFSVNNLLMTLGFKF